MANITTYLENKLLEHSIKGNWTTSLPTTTYAALFIVAPTATTAGTEVGSTDAGYSRISMSSKWGTAANGSIANSDTLTWTATGYWNTTTGATSSASITSIGIFDASTSGNLLWFGPLSSYISMASGDTFSIQSGSLVLTLS